MADHFYTLGDTGPVLQDRLQTPSGADYDLTDHTIQFRAELADDPAVTATAAGSVNAAEVDGKLPYADLVPSAALFPQAGLWLYRWVVIGPNGRVYSFPNDGEWFTLLVSEGPVPA